MTRRKTFYEKLSPHEKRFVDKDYMRISKRDRKRLISNVYHRRIKVPN